MMVLYHLHNPEEPAFAATCNNCNMEMEPGTGWRCTVCPDFDMCNNCKMMQAAHPHPLVVSYMKASFVVFIALFTYVET